LIPGLSVYSGFRLQVASDLGNLTFLLPDFTFLFDLECQFVCKNSKFG
jgi:hypothetical protein